MNRNKNEQKRKDPLFVGAYFSSRFYTPTFVFECFIFCDSLWRGVKLLYWREVLGFLHFEGKFWISFIFDLRKRLVRGRFWFPGERRDFNTGSGSRAPLFSFPLFLFFCLIFYNGSVGAGSGGFFSPFGIVWKWKIHNIHPLYLVLMAKLHHSWITSRGWRFGCARPMYPPSASPPC